MHTFVIKIGSQVIANSVGDINDSVVSSIVADIADIQRAGNRIILVSSGAVASGRCADKLKGKFDVIAPRNEKRGEYKSLLRDQILAAVGQPRLMAQYQMLFAQYQIDIAQILITRADLADQDRYESLCDVVNNLIILGVVPIFNENDVLSPEELDFSDNDQLACMISAAFKADRLVILTNVDGLYDRRPDEVGAERIPVVNDVDEVIGFVDRTKSTLGKGGMQSKLETARTVTSFGIGMHIAKGTDNKVLSRILLRNEALGTSFPAHGKKLRQNKSWLALAAASRGNLYVSTFIAELLRARKPCSIVLIGIERVEGDFCENDVVTVRDLDDVVLGRGNSRLSAVEIREKKGELNRQARLGRLPVSEKRSTPVVIHVDNFAFCPA